MTYKDVYKKFMIEYDKADISSSYPSLTIYEVATLLDKAMLALIAQKVTGNNPRRQTLDLDMKGVADLQSLVTTSINNDILKFEDSSYKNEYVCDIDLVEDVILYILSARIHLKEKSSENISINEYIQIIPKIYSDKFKETSTNVPWIKHPVCYIENNKMHIFVGNETKNKIITNSCVIYIEYIKRPDLFVDKLFETEDTTFILSDTMCEELINLAIIFACRTVGDPRISTEMQTKSLES